PAGKGPKSSEGPQLAEVKTPLISSSNTVAVASNKSEIVTAPILIAKPPQEVAKSPSIPAQPSPTPVAPRKESQKPAPTVAAQKSAEALPAEWKPFGETLSEWLASTKPAAPQRGVPSPQEAPKPNNVSAPIKTTAHSTIAADKSVPVPAVVSKISRKSE